MLKSFWDSEPQLCAIEVKQVGAKLRRKGQWGEGKRERRPGTGGEYAGGTHSLYEGGCGPLVPGFTSYSGFCLFLVLWGTQCVPLSGLIS
jgi:hypothetical protein